MTRISDIVLIYYPADDSGPRCINCYFAAAPEFSVHDMRLSHAICLLTERALRIEQCICLVLANCELFCQGYIITLRARHALDRRRQTNKFYVQIL